MQRLFFFFTLLTKHVLFMYNYVKVKYATSDLVSYYLIHVIFFFQFIPCTYVIFFLLCALLAMNYYIYKKTFSSEHFDVAFVCLNYAPVNVNPHTPGHIKAFKGDFPLFD